MALPTKTLCYAVVITRNTTLTVVVLLFVFLLKQNKHRRTADRPRKCSFFFTLLEQKVAPLEARRCS